MRRLIPFFVILLSTFATTGSQTSRALGLATGCTYATPTPGFNPFTATPAQRAAEGDFPPRPPAGTKAETDWISYANAYTARGVPTCIGGTPSTDGRTAADIWGGWGVHNGTFTDADGTFYVPDTTTGQNLDSAAYWVGVNLGACGGTPCPQPLVQGGVSAGIGYSAPCQMFWQVFPITPNEVYFAHGAQDCWPDDTIYAHATLTTGGGVAIHVVNETHYANDYMPATNYGPECGGQCSLDGHAEGVAENDSSGHGLAHWSTPPWVSGIEFTERRGVAVGSGWKYFNQLSTQTYNIKNGSGTVLATPFPTGLDSVGGGPTWWLGRA